MRTRVLSISRITHISVVATFLLSPTFAQPLCPPCAKNIPKPTGSGTESGRTILNVWLDSSWGTPTPQIMVDGLDEAMNDWNTRTTRVRRFAISSRTLLRRMLLISSS